MKVYRSQLRQDSWVVAGEVHKSKNGLAGFRALDLALTLTCLTILAVIVYLASWISGAI